MRETPAPEALLSERNRARADLIILTEKYERSLRYLSFAEGVMEDYDSDNPGANLVATYNVLVEEDDTEDRGQAVEP